MSMERELPVVLDEEEKNEAGRKCAAEELELRRLEQELRDVSGGLRGQIKKKKAEIKDLATQAETGLKKAMVSCREISDWPSPTLVVREDGRDKDGNKLPEGAPPAVVEEKAPEVQEVEGAAPKATDDKQGDLFASNGAPAAGGKDDATEEEGDDEEDDEAESDEPTPTPPPAAKAKGKKPRKLRLVGNTAH